MGICDSRQNSKNDHIPKKVDSQESASTPNNQCPIQSSSNPSSKSPTMKKIPNNIDIMSLMQSEDSTVNDTQFNFDINSSEQKIYILPSNLASHTDINKKYTISNKCLGKGLNGSVFEASDRSGNKYAVKIINKFNFNAVRNTINEVKLIKSLSYQYILKYYDIYEDYLNVYIVMEIVKNGDLFDYILNSPNEKLSDYQSLELVIQILESINYLHKQKHICHRDIKPENFLVNNDENVFTPKIKLIDFAFATHIKKTKMTDILGTPIYMAPELISGQGYDEKIDIWSAGIILFNMITGCQPFKKKCNIPIDEQIMTRSIPFNKIQNKYMRVLAMKLMEKDPIKRASADEALNFAYQIVDYVKYMKD